MKNLLQLFPKTVVKISLVICLMLVAQHETFGQKLSREVKEKFEAMLDDLSPGLRAKFQTAIDNRTAVVEMSASEFRSFRNNPANPFDINDVDPDDLDGNIQLRFELPSLRNRPVRPYERQSRSLRRNLRGVVSSVVASTAQVTDGSDQVAMATIVREDGLLVTKASEVKSIKNLYVVLGGNRVYQAEILKTDKANDLALLNINASGLKPVTWSNAQPLNGSFVATPNHIGEVISIGSYSVVSRSTVGENRGFLGVAPAAVQNGVKIVERIESNTAAYAAGLRFGDVIASINGTRITQVDQLVYEISRRQAGDEVSIDFLRDGRSKTTVAKLAGRNLNSERAARFKMMSRLGAIPSERNSEFPVVFQHDSPLFPEQCGGPICDLNGNVLGINIARESRAATYAIPASQVKTALDQWLRFDVAALRNEAK